LGVADDIRRGRCNVQELIITLAMHQGTTPDAPEAVKAVASAIRLDQKLDHLRLEVEDGFTDEAGAALSEGLAVNTNLCKIILSSIMCITELRWVPPPSTHSVLRVNMRRERKAHIQMRIEQRLNKVGRRKLLSSGQTPREEWADALHELNFYNVHDSPAFQISCLHSLLRLNPSVVCMS
jgi:hypothetical protein